MKRKVRERGGAPRPSHDRRWQAVQARDALFDGAFVYGVRSTGIYCRPSCPSRRPQRDQVVFFNVPGVAEQAGFRPCQRCRPREARVADPRAGLVTRVCRYIETGLTGGTEGETRLTLGALGAEFGVSSHRLLRAFHKVLGVTPRQYAEASRLSSVKTQLKEGKDVTTSLYEAGYGSSSRLYEKAPAHLGMTPDTYRRGGRGMRIGYTIVDSPLGRLLVAATEKGVCAVSLGDSDDRLKQALFSEYPNAERVTAGDGLREWTSAILKQLGGRRPDQSVPVDVQATAFQERVWRELRRIPFGSRCSYTEIARSLGQPSAARAVARAIATNPVSVVIPCHRVVRKSGELGGYRWGLGRKEALLETERQASREVS